MVRVEGVRKVEKTEVIRQRDIFKDTNHIVILFWLYIFRSNDTVFKLTKKKW